jgi:hypothetical protein
LNRNTCESFLLIGKFSFWCGDFDWLCSFSESDDGGDISIALPCKLIMLFSPWALFLSTLCDDGQMRRDQAHKLLVLFRFRLICESLTLAFIFKSDLVISFYLINSKGLLEWYMNDRFFILALLSSV